MRYEKNETPARVVLTFARARFDSNENQDGEFLSFALQISENRFKNCNVDSNCHQSTDAVAIDLPAPVHGRSPGKRRAVRADGRFVHTFTMEVQVCVSCEIFHLTAHFTANHRRA